ncbi:aspartic peptidase domain-containing protein [Mycena galericulata]|nr:aspartic peptidase domain-containing protein [Mycena galericulata]
MPSLFLALLSLLVSHTLALPTTPKRFSGRYNDGLSARNAGKRAVEGTVGLGDNSDLLYTVPIQLGETTTVVNLDTGSSDLWVISSDCVADACAKASQGAVRVPTQGLKNTGADVTMRYGDSTTGSFASGPIAMATVGIAGVAINNQLFGAINDTTNTVVEFGAAGIFGLGFPSESQIQGAQVTKQFGVTTATDHFVASSYADGPLISRIAQSGALEEPMFTISLQSTTIDIGGTGALTLGTLPPGIDNSSITWVPVRLYTGAEGGLTPPSFAPNEVYPLRWEVEIDGVYLDGKELPASTIPATGGVDSTAMSALIDTGNSILRGPSDVVSNILSTISPNYNAAVADSATLPCLTAHNLSFKIGGQMFPIDPRDLIAQSTANSVETCTVSNIVATDPPSVGALFRWSLGDPFLKSNLVAFHYGNLTNPSQDPPRIGFLSQVPADAAALLTQAVQNAEEDGGNFSTTIIAAPTAAAAAEAEVTVSPTSASEQAAALTGTHAAPVGGATGAAGSNVAAAPTNNASNPKPSNGARRLGLWDPWLLVLGAAAVSVGLCA